MQYLEPPELDRFIAAVKAGGDPMHLAIFEVAFHRGLRASEVGLLKIEDVDVRRETINVHRLKGGDGGKYECTDRELLALRAWLAVRGFKPGPVFPSKLGRPISRQRLDEITRNYARLANLPRGKRHFHCFRHTCAVMLLDNGADVADVKDMLGHRNIMSTMKYVRITNRRRTDLAKRLKGIW
jgi:integrase